jgi:hypothetical protein
VPGGGYIEHQACAGLAKIKLMKGKKELQTSHPSPAIGDREAIEHFKQAMASGKHWYIALLEAIGLWSSREETHNGRHYCYLIEGQAFDWLLLAERLCQEANGYLPEDEISELLLRGKPPIELTEEEFKTLIGSSKYCAYLNYLYGVIVERALLFAVEEEIDKEQRAHVYQNHPQDSYQRIYGADQQTLLKCFRQGKGYPQRSSINLSELQEFTYWLFKNRLRNSDRARVASDTKKALAYLERLRRAKQFSCISYMEEPTAASEL